MKVLIALASSSGQLSGVQRHAINLARCLLTRPEITAVHLVAAPWQQGFVQDSVPNDDERLHLHTAPIGNNALSRNLWFYAQLPRLSIQLDVDVVHLAYPVPVQPGAFHCPVVVTLHDLYPYDIPENFGFPKVLFNRAVLRRCLRRVDAIACVSQTTLSRLKSVDSRLAQKATVVIYNSVESKIRPEIEPQASATAEIAPPEWGSPPFLLCVAQHRRNKNILLALRVFNLLLRSQRLAPGTRLLIVGIPGPETSAIQKYIAASALTQSVVLLNGIPEAQLQWYYRNCSLLLAPSILEGFGLPVAEALLAGCRIVCSDIPAFRELGGNHCHYVPLSPRAVAAFAEAVSATLHEPVPEPIALPQLSAPVIAEQYLQLYRSLSPAPVMNPVLDQAPFPTAGERQHLL
jgi:glycosyltransferase involved in cell wall biosynthesis